MARNAIIVAICELSLIAWAYPRREEDRMRKITFRLSVKK